MSRLDACKSEDGITGIPSIQDIHLDFISIRQFIVIWNSFPMGFKTEGQIGQLASPPEDILK